MMGALRHRRGTSGMTLVLPGAAALKEIAAKTNKVEKSGDNAAAEELETLLRAHILPVKLVSVDDWMQAPVGSDLRKRVGVKQTQGSKVVLENGAELERDPDFKQYASKFRGDRGETQSVWRLAKGEMPMDGAAWEPQARPGKTGGSDSGDCRRRCFGEAFEKSEALARSQPGFRFLEPFLTRAVSLLNFLEMNAHEVYARVLAMVSADPVSTLVILLEPYRAKDAGACISDELLQRWNGEMVFIDAQAEYLGHLEAAQMAFGTPDVLEKAAAIRQKISALKTDAAAFAKAIGNAYTELGGAEKQWRDEVRFDSLCWQNRRAAGDDEPFVCFECLMSHRKRALMNIPTLRGDLLSAPELFGKIEQFVQSPAFLYVPASAEVNVGTGSCAHLFKEALERLQTVQCRLMNENTAAVFVKLLQKSGTMTQ